MKNKPLFTWTNLTISMNNLPKICKEDNFLGSGKLSVKVGGLSVQTAM